MTQSAFLLPSSNRDPPHLSPPLPSALPEVFGLSEQTFPILEGSVAVLGMCQEEQEPNDQHAFMLSQGLDRVTVRPRDSGVSTRHTPRSQTDDRFSVPSLRELVNKLFVLGYDYIPRLNKLAQVAFVMGHSRLWSGVLDSFTSMVPQWPSLDKDVINHPVTSKVLTQSSYSRLPRF